MKLPIVIIKNVLLGFVLVTIGFSVGKIASSKKSNVDGPVQLSAVSKDATRVEVIYAHTSHRCSTCMTLEKLTRETLDKRFSEEVDDGLVILRTVNFQEDEAFAQRYGISSTCLIVNRESGGDGTDYDRLDGIWTRNQDPEEFENYVAEAVLAALAEPAGEVE